MFPLRILSTSDYMLEYLGLIEELRQSANVHQWSKVYAPFVKLIARMRPWDAILLAISQIAVYLPIFESYHPDCRWPRSFLTVLLGTGRIEGYEVVWGFPASVD